MPVNGTGNVSALAYKINTDFWAWAPGNLGGPEPRAWENFNPGNPTNITINISALPTNEANLVQQELALWHEVANITFTYTTGAANITYTDADATGVAHISQVTIYDALTSHRWITSAAVNVPSNWNLGVGGGPATGIDSGYFDADSRDGPCPWAWTLRSLRRRRCAKRLLQYKFDDLRQ